MSTAVPLPRSRRRRDYEAVPGQTIFGPTDFPVFDPEDVRVRLRPVGARAFVTLTSGFVVSLSNQPEGSAMVPVATVTFASSWGGGETVRVEGARVHARTTDVTRAGSLQTALLEREEDKQATVLQELRRDVEDIDERVTAPEIALDARDRAEAARDVAVASAGANIANIDSRATAELMAIPNVISYVRTAGDAAVADRGGALWKTVPAEPAHPGKWKSQDNVWREYAERLVYPHAFGVKANGIDDDTVAWGKIRDYVNYVGGHVAIMLPPGVSKIGNLAPFLADHTYIVGEAPGPFARIQPQGGFTFAWGDTTKPMVTGGGLIDVGAHYAATPPAGSILGLLPNSNKMRFVNLDVAKARQILRCGEGNGFCAIVEVSGLNGFIANAGVPAFQLVNGAGFDLTSGQLYVEGVVAPTHPNPHTVVAGTDLISANEGHWDTINLAEFLGERFDSPLRLSAGNGVVLNNMWLTACVFDYTKNGIILDAQAGGNLIGLHMVNSWCTPWEGTGLTTSGAGTNWGHQIIGNRFALCGLHGMVFGANTHNFVVKGNQAYAVNRLGVGASGLVIAGGNTDFQIEGNHLGVNAASVGLPYDAAYGLAVGPDCDDFIIANNIARGSVKNYDFGANALPSLRRKIINNTGPNFGADYGGVRAGGVFTAPASLVAWQNTTGFVVDVYVSGGAVTAIELAGTLTGLANGCFTVEPGEALKLEYAGDPGMTFKVRR